MLPILQYLPAFVQQLAFKAFIFFLSFKTTKTFILKNIFGDKVVERADGNGDTVTSVEYEGMFVPSMPGITRRLNDANKIKVRDDDIWIVNYQKSGTHWMYDILHMLLSGEAQLKKEQKVESMFPEFVGIDEIEKLASPRVLDTHVPVQFFPKEVLENSKIVYTIRNPKDTMVSFYHHMKGMTVTRYNGQWSGAFRAMMDGNIEYGSWFDHTEDWLKALKDRPNVLIVQFEDMKKDLKTEIKRIAEFIGYPRPELYDAITEQASFGNMKKNKKELDVWKPGCGIFRKGMVGDWQNYFTLAQNAEMDAKLEEKKSSIPIKLKFT